MYWDYDGGPPLYKKLFFEPEVTINLESKIGLFYKKMGSSKSFTEKKISHGF